MNNLNQNISPEQLAAYLSNQMSAEDAAFVQNWINSSEQNQKDFEQYKTIWEETGKLIPTPIFVDVESAWNAMSARVDAFENKKEQLKQNTHKKLFTRLFMIRAAAVVIIPLLVVAVLHIFKTKTQIQQNFTQVATNITVQDTLSDGSIIALNKNSKITYPKEFHGNTREVKMEGEAFFKIAPNKQMPFIIHAENTLIKVVGTKFNVKSYINSPEIEVLVESGTVVFMVVNANTKDTSAVTLIAGDKGIYNKNTKQLAKIKAVNTNDLYWSNKTLDFNKTELSDVVQTLEKCYNIKISLKNNEMKKLHFTSKFINQPIDSILFILENALDLKSTKDGTNYTLIPNEE